MKWKVKISPSTNSETLGSERSFKRKKEKKLENYTLWSFFSFHQVSKTSEKYSQPGIISLLPPSLHNALLYQTPILVLFRGHKKSHHRGRGSVFISLFPNWLGVSGFFYLLREKLSFSAAIFIIDALMLAMMPKNGTMLVSLANCKVQSLLQHVDFKGGKISHLFKIFQMQQ